MCHYIDNEVNFLKLWLKYDYQLFNMSIDKHKELWDVGN
jgi:hypothetical protein